MTSIIFEDETLFYVLVGCLSGFAAIVILLLSVYFFRKRRLRESGKGTKYNSKPYQPPVTEKQDDDNHLLFVFNTVTERQKSPVGVRSCPNSPENSDAILFQRSSSYLDLIQPRLASDTFNASDFDLQMYRDEALAVESLGTGEFGRILISILYDPNQEILCILINCGENLYSKGSSSSVSPYLKVCLLPDKKRRMHSKTRKGVNPVFDEEFVFSVPSSELGKRVFRIAVCDFDRFSRQTIIGYAMVRLEEYREVLMAKRETGEFWVDLQDTDALPGVKKGDLLFSLSHLPTACRMTLSVVQAKDLSTSIADRDTGVSVKVNLILNGKIIKSKKTSINKSDLIDPVFNESFVFEITNDILDRISFVLIVYTYSGNSKRIIGKANTGPYMYSTGVGLTQWNDMLLQPRRAVSHWHKLM